MDGGFKMLTKIMSLVFTLALLSWSVILSTQCSFPALNWVLTGILSMISFFELADIVSDRKKVLHAKTLQKQAI